MAPSAVLLCQWEKENSWLLHGGTPKGMPTVPPKACHCFCFVNLDPTQQNSNFLGFNEMLTHIPFSENATRGGSSSRLPEVLCFKPSPKILVHLLSFSSYKWFMRSNGRVGILGKQQIPFPASSPQSTASPSTVLKAITNHSKHYNKC